ncbi:MAG: A/G-specific adenine glycosylase [Dysgonomonas sp.]|nr:A/G-specific adenine glycosylase [Dysgonomonas sp.]
MVEAFSYISDRLTEWYKVNKRELPWRETKDPYLIWISEIILQQTRVVQGYDYYIKFTKAFPDVKSLANAHEDEVLKLWQGLGYYSRARNLHAAAKMIISDYNGVFPSDYNNILSLKGIGEYTAAAIGSFAFSLPYAVVDGNVFRFLSRFFAIDTPINTTQGKKIFTELANELLDQNNPGDHNQAIMEFGALQCVPVSPGCSVCPLSDKCLAYAKNEVSMYPVKEGKTKVKERFFNYLDIRCGDFLYLNKRTGNDIWKNLYELPLIETAERLSFEQLQDMDEFKALVGNIEKASLKSTYFSLKHVLSHRIIYANFYQIEIDDDTLMKEKYQKINAEDLDSYAISRLVDRYFESINRNDLFS